MREHSAHLTSLPIGFPTWLWRYTCLLLLILRLWHRQAIRSWEVWDTKLPADWMSTHKPTELLRIKLKTWTQQPVAMMIGFRTWLWRYTCVFLLISMLWHRQVSFESKGDKLSSSMSQIVPILYLHVNINKTQLLIYCWQSLSNRSIVFIYLQYRCAFLSISRTFILAFTAKKPRLNVVRRKT